MSKQPRSWQGHGFRLTLDQPHVIGILNTTPDSFSDGGIFTTERAAVTRGLEMAAQGAAMLDIGGESTRPGAHRISEQEQIRRTAKIIAALRRELDVRGFSNVAMSIDTTRSSVAQAALDAGAVIINDVAAGLEDHAMFELAAARGCGMILMHRRAAPDRDQYSHEYTARPVYDDVVADVAAFLKERAKAALAAGVSREAIVIDPGLGFGKSVEDNSELIRRTSELASAGFPLLSAASRKSFIGAVANVPLPADRDPGSIAVALEQFRQGVQLFRVHDVAGHVQALRVAATTSRAPDAVRSS
ncbi:MAG: dihydropteroate synthase [Phycisphaerales bacterium]